MVSSWQPLVVEYTCHSFDSVPFQVVNVVVMRIVFIVFPGVF